MRIADEEREPEYQSFKIWPYREEKREQYENHGFGMIIRSGERFKPIVKYYFEKHPDKTCLIYSMWSGYESLPDVAEILECSKEHTERVHVSGHITKEDLEQVIEIIRPEQLIIHHTSVDKKEKSNLLLPKVTTKLTVDDGEEIVI